MLINIYTDGACSPNPGLGGWAAYFIFNDKEYSVYGYEENSTNNRMELLSAIKGLALIKQVLTEQNIPLKAVRICIISDSQYLVNTMTAGWSRNKDQDLWDILDELYSEMNVEFKLAKGHDLNLYNIKVDDLAVKARIKKENKTCTTNLQCETTIDYSNYINTDLIPPTFTEEPSLNVRSSVADEMEAREKLMLNCIGTVLKLDDEIHSLAEQLRKYNFDK